MKNKRFLTILSITILLLAIGGWYLYSYTRDSWIPSRTKMAQAIADIYLVDAVAQNGSFERNRNERNMERLYRSVLGKYGINKTQYDSIIAIYSQDPTSLASLYEDVIAILTKRDADFENLYNKHDSIQKRITALNDSLRITYWKGPSYIHIPLSERDTLNKNMRFSFKLDSIKGGTITYAFDYTFPRLNKNKDDVKTSLIVVYDKNNADTCLTPLYKDKFSTQHFILEHKLRDTIPATEMKICFIDSKKIKEHTANFSAIKLSYMPYEITDSVQFDEIQLPALFAY
ncbi:MAG: DUF4296 domain-containing protein [Bacteroidia bacterium]|nr:DUF4296 domain-containing protein [Bacteroidia bacterium]